MGQIEYRPEVQEYLYDLVRVLYKKGYFGFMESAQEYVDGITNDIERYIHTTTHHPTTGRLKKYGKYYASFPRKHKRTTWYVFFNKNKDRYSIKYIVNNHGPKAAIIRELR